MESRIFFRFGRFLLYVTMRGILFEVDLSLYFKRSDRSSVAALPISRDSSSFLYPLLRRSFFSFVACFQKSVGSEQILFRREAWLKAIAFFVELGW